MFPSKDDKIYSDFIYSENGRSNFSKKPLAFNYQGKLYIVAILHTYMVRCFLNTNIKRKEVKESIEGGKAKINKQTNK